MQGKLTGVRIAIIEEDALLRKSIGLFLQARGGCVELYGSAEEARDAVMGGGFDLVIGSYLLPGENGLSFLRRVRGLSDRTGTVLIVTGSGKDIPNTLPIAGIDYILAKPFSTTALEAALWRIIERKETGGQGIVETK